MGRLNLKSVVVGIIYDQERGFLLPYNKPWKHYAFVMKQVGDGKAAARVAVDALREDIRLRFPDAKATAVDRFGAPGKSERTGEESYYDYTVYAFDLGTVRAGAAKAGEARFYAYEDLLTDRDVSWSTKEIAKALVQRREVVAAVVARPGPSGPECLLVNSRPQLYFLPSTRRKSELPPEAVAAAAIHQDTGYQGPVTATWIGEQEIMQTSHRFGKHETQFRFHICRAVLPDCELTDEKGPFAAALRNLEQREREAEAELLPSGYFKWCPVADLRYQPDISPTLQQLVAMVIKAAE